MRQEIPVWDLGVADGLLYMDYDSLDVEATVVGEKGDETVVLEFEVDP